MISDRDRISPERLGRKALHTLYEAVNTGRLVAFVGSGVSLVYGQPTWTQFVDMLIEKLEKSLEPQTGRKPPDRFKTRVEAMIRTIKNCDKKDSLVVLELAQRTFATIDELTEAPKGESGYHREMQSLFAFNATEKDVLEKRIRLAGFSADLTPRQLYSVDLLEAIVRDAPSHPIKRLAQELVDEVRRQRDPEGSNLLPIDRRSVMNLFLAFASEVNLPELVERAGDELEPVARPLLDPLRDIDEWLRVRRYLTTNYDLGLEQLHLLDADAGPLKACELREGATKAKDMSFAEEAFAVVRQLADGRVVRSEVNDGRHVAALIDFAIGGVDNAIHIYHHHGRVDQPKTMIAADSEYNRLYRDEGSVRSAFDHAYDVLIAGNPILFVGSGMSEEELNRVLRANVTNPDVIRAAPAIVLREATGTGDELVLEQVNLATKLGVHVIQHGHPSRGARYALRDHLMLLDAIAVKFGLKQIHALDSEYKVKGMALPGDLGALRDRFRLIWDLDYDRYAVAWLLQADAGLFKRKPTKTAWHKQELLKGYLQMLSQKLITAALRHELRQIGHEASQFYRDKSTWIKPRAFKHQDLIRRHVSRQRRQNDVAIHLTLWEEAQRTETCATSLAEVLAQPWRQPGPIRAIVLGKRGAGKGCLLSQLAYPEKDAKAVPHKRALLLNCAYGHEVDSILSLIADFLKAPTQSDDLTRRERILACLETPRPGKRPLIVLGAVDRLFGTDDAPLAAEFEWLLDQVTTPTFPADVIITGSMRCHKYFRTRYADLTGTLQTGMQASEGRKRHPLSVWRRLIAASSKPARALPELWIVQPTSAKRQNGTEAGNMPVPPAPSRFFEKVGKVSNKLEEAHVVDRGDWEARAEMAHGERRADLIIGRVLALLQRDRVEMSERGEKADGRTTADGFLVIEIAKALAFIGIPVEADILLSVPAVRRRLEKKPTGRVQAFKDALNFAWRIGLVPRVEAVATDSNPSPALTEDRAIDVAITHRHRFAVHRLVSQVVRDRYGIPNSETVLSDSYSLSLYAVQPDDAATPEADVAQSLEELIDHLMNAWKDVGLKVDSESLSQRMKDARDDILANGYSDPLALHYLERLDQLRRQLAFQGALPAIGLRAAGAVIRSYYSAVNLFGLDVSDPRSRTGEVGAITAHKARIGRLLDLTRDAQQSVEQLDGQPDWLDRHLFEVPAVTTDEAMDQVSRAPQNLVVDPRVPLVDCEPDSEAGKREDPPWTRRHPEYLKDLRKFCAGVARTRIRALSVLEETNPAERTRPFFSGEIVWLYNERAMLALAQGDLYTASTAFKLAAKANHGIEGERVHPNNCRLTVNRALLSIERGRIAEARRSLESLIAGLGSTPDAVGRDTREGQLIIALCDGYIGLSDHLFGMTANAERRYRRALRALSRLREQRAIAIFELHLATLLRLRPDAVQEADAALARALAAANGGRHTDILYRIRIAKAHSDQIRERVGPAQSKALLDAAVDYGNKLDMHRVSVEALCARAQLQLHLGDADSASRDISRAAAKASQFGLTLRRIWCRVMTGKVYEMRGDHINARLALERAISEASRIGYERAIHVANVNLLQVKSTSHAEVY